MTTPNDKNLLMQKLEGKEYCRQHDDMRKNHLTKSFKMCDYESYSIEDVQTAIKEQMKEAEDEIDKLKKEHREDFVSDDDGFVQYICEVSENLNTRVAPLNEWRGTKESWEESMKEQEERDKDIVCSHCESFDALKAIVRKHFGRGE